MMKRLMILLLALLLGGGVVGCGSSPEPSKHKDRDLPQPADKGG